MENDPCKMLRTCWNITLFTCILNFWRRIPVWSGGMTFYPWRKGGMTFYPTQCIARRHASWRLAYEAMSRYRIFRHRPRSSTNVDNTKAHQNDAAEAQYPSGKMRRKMFQTDVRNICSTEWCGLWPEQSYGLEPY